MTVNLPKQEEKTFCRTAERSVSGLMHPALKWLWDYEFEIRKQEKLPCILAHIFSFFLPFVILTSMISSSQVCICLEASLKSVSFVATGLMHAYTYELPFYSKKVRLKKHAYFLGPLYEREIAVWFLVFVDWHFITTIIMQQLFT